jgi:hypothetical protein
MIGEAAAAEVERRSLSLRDEADVSDLPSVCALPER